MDKIYNLNWLNVIYYSSASTGLKSGIKILQTSVWKSENFPQVCTQEQKSSPGAETLGMKEEDQGLFPFNESANSHLNWQHSGRAECVCVFLPHPVSLISAVVGILPVIWRPFLNWTANKETQLQ